MSTEQISIVDTIDNQFKSIYELLGNHNKRTKEIQENLKTLHKTTKGAAKQAKTNKKRFQEKLNVSNDLAKFLNMESGAKLTKAEVMKSVSEYIKTNNLQLQENKRKFKPNKQMSKIFQMKPSDNLTFVEINKHVSGHLSR
jgi:chromatin remodeling complex protein RSC6